MYICFEMAINSTIWKIIIEYRILGIGAKTVGFPSTSSWVWQVHRHFIGRVFRWIFDTRAFLDRDLAFARSRNWRQCATAHRKTLCSLANTSRRRSFSFHHTKAVCATTTIGQKSSSLIVIRHLLASRFVNDLDPHDSVETNFSKLYHQNSFSIENTNIDNYARFEKIVHL